MTAVSVKSLSKGLAGVEKGQIILVETTAEKISSLSFSVVEILTKKKGTMVLLAASKPCTTLLASYTKNKVPIEHLLILDCVCKTAPSEVKAFPNVIHLSGASALTSISLVMTESLKKISGAKLVVIDSINGMLIHNQAVIFGQFIHSLLTKMRLLEAGGVLLSLETETDKTLRAEIVQLCDKVVKV